MIDASELRIGNVAMDTIYARIVSIFGISPVGDNVWVHSADGQYKYRLNEDKIDPIPLTPEILEKFGFVKVEDLGDMLYYQMPKLECGYGICFNHEDIEFYRHVGSKNYALIYNEPHLQYLHQLQNLYCALVGTEITERK